MFPPSTSRDPFLTRGGESDSDEEGRVRESAADSNIKVGALVHLANLRWDQSLTPIAKSTVVEGVDANALMLEREDQRFIFVEFSPDWTLVVTVTSHGTFSVWDATNKWVLVGLKRLHHTGRTLKCIAFDPFKKEAVLLCFDRGEIFRTNLGGLRTADAPGSSQEEGMFCMELIYKCEGRVDSHFAHFKFSSDRKIMVYYSLDGELVVLKFQEQGGLKSVSLSKDFVLKNHPNISISGQSILITAVMKSSEDHDSSSEDMETLLWPRLDFEAEEIKTSPVRINGKGYISKDGRHLLVSMLATEHQSMCCQINAYLVKNDKSIMDAPHNPIATRTLRFVSNHPHMECLESSKFNFLNTNHGSVKPLIAIHQTNSAGTRLVFWDANSDVLIYEIDLTMHEGVPKFSEIKHCFSSDCKWLGVCSFGTNMLGLVCARSGVFIWMANIPQINREDLEFCTLRFSPSGTRLMISLGKVIYLFEPSCLSTKPQRHPINHGLSLSETSRTYADTEILDVMKSWPKQVLFNVLLAGQRKKPEIQYLLLDVAISLTSKRLALICRKYEGHRFLSVVEYSRTPSWDLLWFVVMSRWNQCCLSNNTSPLVKEIEENERLRAVSVFFYHNEEKNVEQIVLFSSRDGIKVQDFDFGLRQQSELMTLCHESGFSFAQSKDRRSIISLADKHVLIIDLNRKSIVKTIEYTFSLSQWWASLLDSVKFVGHFQYCKFTDQEWNKEHTMFLQESLLRFFDVSDDGKTVLIGWDTKQKRSLVVTPDKSEEQFRIQWEEARESLYQCSMMTFDGQWVGFIDYKKLRDGDIVVSVVNTISKYQQQIWLGFDKLMASSSTQNQLSIANFFLCVDDDKEQLIIMRLEVDGISYELKEFFVRLVHDAGRTEVQASLLETMVQPTKLDKYNKENQHSLFNMRVANISNFQRFLLEEGEDGVEKAAKCALENKVKVSNMYVLHQDKEQDSTTFLAHALKKQEDTLVQLCLKFLEDGLFTFHSSSAMVKDSFFDLLFFYNELFMPMLKDNSLIFKVGQVKVPTRVFKSQNDVSNVVFTSDTIFEPIDHFVKIGNENFWDLKNKKQHTQKKNLFEGFKVPSIILFHCITNACKIGLNGITRKLLMLKVPEAIFETNLIRATINWKWERLWKGRCLRELVLYVVFLVLFTSYALGIGFVGDKLVHERLARVGFSFLLLGVTIVALVFTYYEYMQVRAYIKDGKKVFGTYMWGLKHYFLDSQWNVVELFSYFLVLVLIPIFHGMYIFQASSKKVLFVLVAIESILAWFKLWYYAQPFERTGALVLLISNVVHDCLPFLFLALVVLIGFSVALYVLFQFVLDMSSSSALEGEGEEYIVHESFESPWRSLSTLFYAMVGTFEVEVYYNHQSLSWLTTLIFILYMALEMIVMLNMIIAIMGDTFDRVKSEEDIKITIGRARFIDACEASLTARQIMSIEKQIGKYVYILTPEDGQHATKRIGWKGKINVIEKNVKKAIDALESNVIQRIEENKKAVNDKIEKMENKIGQQFEQIREFMQKHLEVHRNKDQNLLRSNIERVEALEMESNQPTSSGGGQVT